MYLSRIKINTDKSLALKAIANPEITHGIIENSFSGERRRNLWRIDDLQGSKYLLLMSEVKPNLEFIVEKIGFQEEAVSKDYGLALQNIVAGSHFYFKIIGNPVKRGRDTHRIIPLIKRNEKNIDDESEETWLERKAGLNGFSLRYSKVTARDTIKFSKNQQTKITIHRVTYEGILEVTEIKSFINALMNGIGREKAYGCGMLTIMTIEENTCQNQSAE